MDDRVLVSGLDTVIFMAPFLWVLAFWLLGLDHQLAAPKQRTKPWRTFCGLDPIDGPLFSDPDGTPWKNHRIKQIEASLVRAPHLSGSD